MPSHSSRVPQSLRPVLALALALLLTSPARAAFGRDAPDSAAPAASLASAPAGGDAPGGNDDAEDALARAKRLVQELNDASTGTVTSYRPGQRTMAAATCDDILSRSLVTANEEKAAIAAERDSVVLAASLLSDKNDALAAEVRELAEARDAARRAREEADEEGEARLAAATAASQSSLQEAEAQRQEEEAASARRAEEAAEQAAENKARGERALEEARAAAAEDAAAKDKALAAKLAQMEESLALAAEERAAERTREQAEAVARAERHAELVARAEEEHAAQLATKDAEHVARVLALEQEASAALDAAQRQAKEEQAAQRDGFVRQLAEMAASNREDAKRSHEIVSNLNEDWSQKMAEMAKGYDAQTTELKSHLKNSHAMSGQRLADERERHLKEMAKLAERFEHERALTAAKSQDDVAAAKANASAAMEKVHDLEERLAALQERAGEKERLLVTKLQRLDQVRGSSAVVAAWLIEIWGAFVGSQVPSSPFS